MDQISGIFVVDFYVTVFRLIFFICERHRNFNSSLAEDSTCKAVANLTRIKANRSRVLRKTLGRSRFVVSVKVVASDKAMGFCWNLWGMRGWVGGWVGHVR